MEIEKDYQVLKACRFCPMCKYLCSSGQLTKHESDYPRGRALILYSVFRGEKYNSDFINSIYNCIMCGCCKAGCEGNYNLPDLIRLSRNDIVNLGLEPECIKKLKEDIINSGNSFGKDKKLSFTFLNEHCLSKSDFKNANVLHIFGECINYNNYEVAKAIIDLYSKLKINFSFLKEEPDTGKILSIIGYEKDAINNAKLFFHKLKNLKVEYLVTSDPLTYDCLKNDFYRWGLDLENLNIKLIYFTDFIERVISNNNKKFKKYLKRTVVIDSEYLCKFNNMCENYRNILKEILDNFFIELPRNKKDSYATGEAAFYHNNEKFNLGELLVSKIYNDAKELEVQSLITLSTTAKENLRSLSEKDNGIIEVYDIAEFINNYFK